MAEVELSENDNEKVVQARLGDEVIIRLKEQPTTGYRWTIDAVSEQLEQGRSGFSLKQGGGVGGGGEKVMRFIAKRRGSAQIELKRMRSWEGDVSNAERFRVSVNIF